jgi:hypothetical protein
LRSGGTFSCKQSYDENDWLQKQIITNVNPGEAEYQKEGQKKKALLPAPFSRKPQKRHARQPYGVASKGKSR